VLKQDALSAHYQLVIGSRGELDHLTVNVERGPMATDEQCSAAVGALRHDIKGYVGISVSIDIVDPGYLPRSRGKAQRIIDRRGE
jgi:phenylacetate-CoA ligase